MTNKQKILSSDEKLIIHMCCPYLPGKNGAKCLTSEEQVNADFHNDCMSCMKKWLDSEANDEDEMVG